MCVQNCHEVNLKENWSNLPVAFLDEEKVLPHACCYNRWPILDWYVGLHLKLGNQGDPQLCAWLSLADTGNASGFVPPVYEADPQGSRIVPVVDLWLIAIWWIASNRQIADRLQYTYKNNSSYNIFKMAAIVNNKTENEEVLTAN